VPELDINADGKLGVADAVTLILRGAADETQPVSTATATLSTNLTDVIKLLSDIWGTTLLAGQVELINFQMDLTAEQIPICAERDRPVGSDHGTGRGVPGRPERQRHRWRAVCEGVRPGSERSKPVQPEHHDPVRGSEGKAGTVSLKVYDIRGRLVRSLVDATKDARHLHSVLGRHQ